MVDLDSQKIIKDVVNPVNTINGIITTLFNIVIVLVLFWLGLIFFKGVLISVIGLIAIIFGFVISYFLIVNNYLKGQELSSWDWGVGLSAPILAILIAPLLSSYLLNSMPFSIVSPTASITGVSDLTSNPTSSALVFNGISAVFIPSILFFTFLLLIVIAYKQSRGK
jgi:hypothetical protein